LRSGLQISAQTLRSAEEEQGVAFKDELGPAALLDLGHRTRVDDDAQSQTASRIDRHYGPGSERLDDLD
jgi:hypothetical protein